MFSGQRPHAHERHRHWRHDSFGERTDFFGSPADLGAAPDVDYGAVSLGNSLRRALDLTGVPFVGRLIPGQVHLFRILKPGTRRLHVFWDIDQDGAWSTGGCDVKRLFYRLWNLARFMNQVAVLRDRECYARYVGLLKGIVADEISGYLTSKRDEGHAIHVGGRDPCDEVRCSGPGGGH